MSLLLAAAALLAGSDCVDALCNPGTLAPYFRKLAEARGQSGRPVHILQIGDSHTAGDAITGAWRDLLQGRYGSGGRGVLAGGRPYAGYLTRGVTATMSDGWSIAATFGAASASPRPPLGLSGFSLTSRRDGARMSLTADPQEAFDRFTICAMTGPRAGALSIRIGTRLTRFELDSFAARPECRTIELDAPQSGVDVATEGGPVTVTSWGTFRDAGGVALSNVGVVGSQLVHFARTDDAVLGEELRAYRPDLIVVAFGTNEGFAPRFSPQEYEITLRTQIGRLRRLAGNVPILLLGAPDASTRRPELRANAPGPTPAYCPAGRAVVPAAVAARPAVAPPVMASVTAPAPQEGLAAIMERVRAEEGQGVDVPVAPNVAPVVPPPPLPPPPVVRQVVASDAGRPPLFPPAGLASVRGVQRRVAASLNLAFWDWEARMGGPCTAPAWVRANPPLMRGDYVHFTSAGGREIAGRLQADLERAAAAGQR
jgi:lysophospholipase L1-like esterase